MDEPATTVHVALDQRSYEILIGAGQIDQLPRQLARVAPKCRHAVVITDSQVAPLHGHRVETVLSAAGYRSQSLIVPAGESSKSVAQAEQLWQQLLLAGADRQSVIIAVGGGVIGDLAGFAAATFARGLGFVQVPTTLLAHVDSSVGGKVGINLPAAKNMVGAFWQPLSVIIDTNTLTTLPDRELVAGLAEVVKYGVILDADFFALLEQQTAAILKREPHVLRAVIARCCRLKADVVQADEREVTGLRAVLNYGHTFAHAIEAVTEYGQFLHGEAVAIGMHLAAKLACRLGRVDQAWVDRQQQLLQTFGLPCDAGPLDPDAQLQAMQRDKKAAQGRLRFVLPTRLGHVELVDNVPLDLVREVLLAK